ncbi:hypothetical protein Dda_2503 [Drechslerella dactyloides]|uniref:Uncharacterized protein n=1 Tax=Drechslerella dactyloides TaxID=74499 RepID=A0AAD6J1Y0_DREDA|nr:hypothetical protein Dda_2503 [Drechslerella dactyloides]
MYEVARDRDDDVHMRSTRRKAMVAWMGWQEQDSPVKGNQEERKADKSPATFLSKGVLRN